MATEKSENDLPYTKLLEPLVRYTVEKNKLAVKELSGGGTGERPKMQLKSQHIIRTLAKNEKEKRDGENPFNEKKITVEE